MKLASYMADGAAAFGVVTANGVITMNARLGTADIKTALGTGLVPLMTALAAKAKPDHKLVDVKFLPAIPNPHKILCALAGLLVPDFKRHATACDSRLRTRIPD